MEILMRSALTKTRRRKALAGAITTLLVMAASSFAYYLIFANGEGSSTQKLGTAIPEVVPLKVTFAPGLVPGQSEPITFSVHNTTATAAKVGELSWKATTNVAGCLPAWFSVGGHGLSGKGEGGAVVTPLVEVPAGSEAEIESGTLNFANEEVNQSACETSTVTITAKSEP